MFSSSIATFVPYSSQKEVYMPSECKDKENEVPVYYLKPKDHSCHNFKAGEKAFIAWSELCSNCPKMVVRIPVSI